MKLEKGTLTYAIAHHAYSFGHVTQLEIIAEQMKRKQPRKRIVHVASQMKQEGLLLQTAGTAERAMYSVPLALKQFFDLTHPANQGRPEILQSAKPMPFRPLQAKYIPSTRSLREGAHDMDQYRSLFV